MKLCLLVSRRCNLRCGFCHVEFTGKDMDWATAKRAVEGYLRWLPPRGEPTVKFFGGEPLLNFPLIRRLVEEAPRLWPSSRLRFELSTNGSFLDKGKKEFLVRHPEVEVTVSQEADKAAGLPGAWFTLVLDKDCSPKEVVASMRTLLKAGFRRFNILPAYYVVWAPEQLRNLELSLRSLAALFNGLEGRRPVRVRNAEVSGSVPLYNDALTVDLDGHLYASNMVQCKGMEPYAPALRLGRVSDRLPWRLRSVDPERAREVIRAWSGPRAWRSTERVDAMLSRFVSSLELSYSGERA